MKNILLLSILLGTIYTQTQSFADKCTCEDDYFVAKLHDERRCLAKKDSDHGIANCVEYSWSAEGLICTKCDPTHAIDSRGQCIPHNLPNCTVGAIKGSGSVFPTYTAGFECTTCQDNFTPNSDKWCMPFPTTINNCTVYEGTLTANNTKCTECQTGFYVKVDDGAACSQPPAVNTTGNIPNCKTYKNADGTAANWECVTCEDTFYRNENTKKACESAPAVNTTGNIPNCKTYKNVDGVAANWECAVCEDNFYRNDNTKKACETPPAVNTTGHIANCKEFENPDGAAANWKCKICQDTFYRQLDTNKSCTAAPAVNTTGHITNCKAYKNVDGVAANWDCETCEDTYIINTATDKCHAQPTDNSTATWTENCKTWTHPTTKYQCSECSGDFYLDTTGTDPKCKPVQRPIAHCTKYSSATVCETCADRYWLEDKTCVKCQADKYVAPTPATCPTNSTTGGGSTGGGSTNSTGGGSTNSTGGGNSKESKATILSAGLVLALVLALF